MITRNWREVELGEVCEFAYGKSLPARERSGSGFPVFGSNGKVGLHDKALTDGETIIIGRKGSFGEVHFSPEPCSPIDTTYFITRNQTSAYLPWLARRLRCLGLNRLNRAAAIPGLNRADAYRQRLLLPPLPEQKRIAEILDAADALRAKRREALTQLDTLLQSTFFYMFGDPVTNPMGWERSLLGEITTIEASMVDPRKPEYGELLHYGPDRIEKNTGQLLPALTAQEEGIISGKFLCSPGEVLYSKIRPYLNKVAIVKERCLCSADVYPVKPNEKNITKEYLWFLLRSEGFLDYVAGFSRRANIPKLNRKQFAGYPAPVPPLSLQHRFATLADIVEQQKVRMRAHLTELDALFTSLQHRAFNGEL